ncbi:MAG: thioredoxin family protein [Agriterribacter sp.]
MKQLFFALIAFVAAGTVSAQITTITPGASAPAFALKNIDNKTVSFTDYPSAKGYIVVFTCNTCPVAKAYEDRIITLHTKYAPLGFPVIAINSNDPSLSTGDTFEQMQQRAKEKNFSFAYLYDEGQNTTNAYGARNTPHIFLVRRSPEKNIVVYTGAIDNDPENNKSDKDNFLEKAITAVMQDKMPEPAVTKAIGCSIKRKGS